MKKNQKQKLHINKFQIAKINTPQQIVGGNGGNDNLEDDNDPIKTSPTIGNNGGI
ncbi:hypothetical protein ACQY1Q_13525 [Tenacibaculum sp. TC6]|uniref:hypothetical protein n=1 Tax=Tenacibaculum sp. TC6 TaxID=3423223 RepID=UPI003D3690AC